MQISQWGSGVCATRLTIWVTLETPHPDVLMLMLVSVGIFYIRHMMNLWASHTWRAHAEGKPYQHSDWFQWFLSKLHCVTFLYSLSFQWRLQSVSLFLSPSHFPSELVLEELVIFSLRVLLFLFLLFLCTTAQSLLGVSPRRPVFIWSFSSWVKQ